MVMSKVVMALLEQGAVFGIQSFQVCRIHWIQVAVLIAAAKVISAAVGVLSQSLIPVDDHQA